MRLFISLIIFAISFCLIKYSYQLIGWFGHIGFIEEKLGAGRSYIFVKILGVAGFFLGFLYLFGRISFGPS